MRSDNDVLINCMRAAGLETVLDKYKITAFGHRSRL
jgi:hypothetical protein